MSKTSRMFNKIIAKKEYSYDLAMVYARAKFEIALKNNELKSSDSFSNEEKEQELLHHFFMSAFAYFNTIGAK